MVVAVVLGIASTSSQTAEACFATYTDSDYNATQNKVEGWAWVEDYTDSGSCFQEAYNYWYYWEHSYHASVSIQSPAQNSAYGFENQNGVSYGGGSANAYAYLPTEGDSGDYIVDWVIWIWCSVLLDNFVEEDEQTVEEVPPVCALGNVDAAAVAAVTAWPLEEPWERAVALYCTGDNLITAGYYGDSFGMFYGGAGYTNDPCTVQWVISNTGLAALAHAHPYFEDLTEFRLGDNCFHDTQYYTQDEIDNLNDVENVGASGGDKTLSDDKGVPMYTRAPSGLRVDRYLNGNEVQVL